MVGSRLFQTRRTLHQMVLTVTIVGLVLGIVRVEAIPIPGEPVSFTEIPSVEGVRDRLEARLDTLKDIRATVVMRQYDPITRALVQDVEFDIQAINPNVARATYRRPDILRGSVYVLDHALNEVYTYNPVLDLAECSRLDVFLTTSPIQPNIESLFALPVDDELSQIDVYGTERIGGRDHVILRVRASEGIVEEVEEVLDDLLAVAPSAMGVQVELTDDTTLYAWVDLDLGIISRMEVYDAEERLMIRVEASQIRMDQGLRVQDLKAFRGADIRRCR